MTISLEGMTVGFADPLPDPKPEPPDCETVREALRIATDALARIRGHAACDYEGLSEKRYVDALTQIGHEVDVALVEIRRRVPWPSLPMPS